MPWWQKLCKNEWGCFATDLFEWNCCTLNVMFNTQEKATHATFHPPILSSFPSPDKSGEGFRQAASAPRQVQIVYPMRLLNSSIFYYLLWETRLSTDNSLGVFWGAAPAPPQTPLIYEGEAPAPPHPPPHPPSPPHFKSASGLPIYWLFFVI